MELLWGTDTFLRADGFAVPPMLLQPKVTSLLAVQVRSSIYILVSNSFYWFFVLLRSDIMLLTSDGLLCGS